MVKAAAQLLALLLLSATVFALHAAPDPATRHLAAVPPAHATRPASAIRVTATAYCHAGTTAAGTRTHTGIVAADPRVLPVGSVLRIVEPSRFAGIYTVLDTGAAVKGRALDIFMPSCTHAVEFGRRSVRIAILRRGWDPQAGEGDSH
jgi:3D (Asp-Asp-Asp) domain-containing protein